MNEELYDGQWRSWLVIGRHTMDDAPMRLFAGEKEAREYAASVTPDMVCRAARWVLKTDASTPVCVAVLPFDADGFPGAVEVVRDFDPDGEPEGVSAHG